MRNFLKTFKIFFQIFLKFYSKFISSFLWISFRIYLKYLIFLKFFQQSRKFSKNFLKNLVKISIKFYLRIAQTLRSLSKISRTFFPFCKLAIHLSFLTFRHVRALFREIANQSLYTFHNIANFGHLWFCEKLDEKLALSSSLTFRENTDHLARMAKREMRKMIGEMFYEMPSIHFSFLSFRQHFFAFSSIWR